MNKRIILPAAAALAAALLASQHHAEARPDAVSAASLTVGSTSITSTTATITWSKDKYDYGTRTLCYDPAPAAPANNCQTKTATSSSGSFKVSGLMPG